MRLTGYFEASEVSIHSGTSGSNLPLTLTRGRRALRVAHRSLTLAAQLQSCRTRIRWLRSYVARALA
jgi:hypothetical protein